MSLKVATCQFPISGDLKKDCNHIVRQMKQAKAGGAHVAHFSETALGGYGGKEVKSFATYDWDTHTACAESILDTAGKLKIWAIVGTNHRLSGKHKPHNSLYIINDRGKLVDRYDKMFCTGNNTSEGDLKHYSPGSRFVTFTIKGVKCGALICYDFRFHELYREYYKLGVKLMFHSYHNGHSSAANLKKYNIWGVIVPTTMQAYAANNAMWISANNTSNPASCWSSFFVRPDGIITGRLTNNRAGVLISTVDTKKKFYDLPGQWRHRAIKGVFHSGTLVKDKRSDDRTNL